MSCDGSREKFRDAPLGDNCRLSRSLFADAYRHSQLPGFNGLDSLIAIGVLNRVRRLSWRVTLYCPEPEVTSMNGVTVRAQSMLSDTILRPLARRRVTWRARWGISRRTSHGSQRVWTRNE